MIMRLLKDPELQTRRSRVEVAGCVDRNDCELVAPRVDLLDDRRGAGLELLVVEPADENGSGLGFELEAQARACSAALWAPLLDGFRRDLVRLRRLLVGTRTRAWIVGGRLL